MDSASTTPLLPAASPIPDGFFLSRVASSLSLSESQASLYVTPPNVLLLSVSLERLPIEGEKTLAVETLQELGGDWELFSKNKIIETITKFFIKKTYNTTSSQFILNYAKKLRDKFLSQNKELNNNLNLPVINYIALVTALRVWSDEPYDLLSFSIIFNYIKSDKLGSKYLQPHGWTPDIAAQSKNISISLDRLKEIEDLFLKGIGWNLEFTETAKEAISQTSL